MSKPSKPQDAIPAALQRMPRVSIGVSVPALPIPTVELLAQAAPVAIIPAPPPQGPTPIHAD